MTNRYRGNGPKNPIGLVKLGVGVMMLGVVLYVGQDEVFHQQIIAVDAAVLLLIGAGFVAFTVGALRYLKTLEAEAKKEIEKTEQEKAYDELIARTENEKKRGELNTMLSAGLISRDEYDCAVKKYKE